MIQIRKSETADTRTCDFTKVSRETLLESSIQHVGDVHQALGFFSAERLARYRLSNATAVTQIAAIFAPQAKGKTTRKLLKGLIFYWRESILSMYRVAERAGFEPAGVLSSKGVPPVDSESTALNLARPPLRYLAFVPSLFLRHKSIRRSSFPAFLGFHETRKITDERLFFDTLSVFLLDQVDDRVDDEKEGTRMDDSQYLEALQPASADTKGSQR